MSLMLNETQSIPAVLQHMLEDDSAVTALADRLARNLPDLMITVARGSSDHAAAYLAHLMMSQIGIPSLSIPLSLVSLNQPPLRLNNAWVAALSQSGKSPDLIASVRYLKSRGARATALVNTPDSPLAAMADGEVLLPAGLEQSVAATKSYVAMLMAAAQTVGHLERNLDMHPSGLLEALKALPQQMERAVHADWSKAVEVLTPADKMLVIGRGPSLSIAQEAALKLKETCGIQAEAFSSAEVKHGPMEIITKGYPILVFAPAGAEQAGTLAFAQEMRERGAKVLVAAAADKEGVNLPTIQTDHALLEPFTMIQSFYVLAEALATARGCNPDKPHYLKKVTETH
ncbi:SIS domain-containing protein [Pseudomonas asuensis]|uniref:Phosphosugar-binding protein n=1 Tax=Pseudomonas asuensis TaxID=1825787 RepID=A0ABQ2GV66_9PSED|nr:SIS domain-containing protein [Pseudomonas asuensis]GGM13381.1 phosphosugar-binding protein [Pseudomonas asuensis]